MTNSINFALWRFIFISCPILPRQTPKGTVMRMILLMAKWLLLWCCPSLCYFRDSQWCTWSLLTLYSLKCRSSTHDIQGWGPSCRKNIELVLLLCLARHFPRYLKPLGTRRLILNKGVWYIYSSVSDDRFHGPHFNRTNNFSDQNSCRIDSA